MWSFSPKSSVMLLVDPSRFEKKKVQFTFHYNEIIESAYGFSFRHVRTKALVKQVGYRKVPPSHSQFFKGPIRKFSKATIHFYKFVFMQSWPNNQGEK